MSHWKTRKPDHLLKYRRPIPQEDFVEKRRWILARDPHLKNAEVAERMGMTKHGYEQAMGRARKAGLIR